VKRLDQTGLGMIEPPSRQRRGATGGRAAGHQNRLDGTLRKNGSSLAVVGFFVDEPLGAAGAAASRQTDSNVPPGKSFFTILVNNVCSLTIILALA
jgi:hypothetical protein